MELTKLEAKYSNNKLMEYDDKMLEELSKSDQVMSMVMKSREKIQNSISFNSALKKSILKGMVSKKKFRFEYEGFNLDLTYITEKIIAMGYPADNIEKLYRNGLVEVKKFFEKRHNLHYKVYNLCAERTYQDNTFFQQAYYPFADHEAPPINLMMPFCNDVHEWLTADPQNIAAIHCKAGKGRTGTMICAYLLFAGVFDTAEDSLRFYGLMRTSNGNGVTIPSQIRYVYYTEHILKSNIPHPIKPPVIHLSKIKLYSVPYHKCHPFFKIDNGESHYNYRKHNKIEYFKNEAYIELKIDNLSVNGDVRIQFFNKKTIGKDKMFSFWFNTFFAPNDGILVIKKNMLDKACKDKSDKLYDASFKVELQYIILDESLDIIDNNKNVNVPLQSFNFMKQFQQMKI